MEINEPTIDFPHHFRCPISMELMKNPVTISTGVTYERNNIEKWFFTYNKKTCPATMQTIQNFTLTPNHTLHNLILSWQQNTHSQSPPRHFIEHLDLISLINTIDSTPFKINSLIKIRSILELGSQTNLNFKRSGGFGVISRLLVQISAQTSDFESFSECEEALKILHQLLVSSEDEILLELLSRPHIMEFMVVMLHRGSAEARFCAISIFQKMAKSNYNWSSIISNHGIDLFKSMLEFVSDNIYNKVSICGFEFLIEILGVSKKSRIKAIEAGATSTLIELIPDSNKPKVEKIFLLIKLLCECADGRLGFIEHGLGIAAVSNKLLNVSDCATKIGVKILWLICNFSPTERVLEEMIVLGTVEKMVALVHVGGGGRSSTKEKVVKMLKLHGNSWRRYPCFPWGLKEYLDLVNNC